MEWEYCVAKREPPEQGGNTKVWELHTAAGGLKQRHWPPELGGGGSLSGGDSGWFRAVAKLGEEGWEIVGFGHDGFTYFKRPKGKASVNAEAWLQFMREQIRGMEAQ